MKRPSAIVHRGFIRRQLDNDVPTSFEDVVKVDVTPRSGQLAVDRDVCDVGSDALRDNLLYGPGVEAFGRDGRADVQIAVVNGIFGDEGGQNEQFGRRWY